MNVLNQPNLQIHLAGPASSARANLEAARSRFKQNRREGWLRLNELFRAGRPPEPPLEGRYPGELVALDVAPGLTQFIEAIVSVWLPWQGKTFNAAQAGGDNIFSRESLPLARVYWPLYRGYVDDGPARYRAFAFRTYLAPGLADPDHQVLKIDYNLPGNPGLTIRRVLDELVQLADGLYLGKAHFQWWWGTWQQVAYFSLSTEKAKSPRSDSN